MNIDYSKNNFMPLLKKKYKQMVSLTLDSVQFSKLNDNFLLRKKSTHLFVDQQVFHPHICLIYDLIRKKLYVNFYLL